MNLALFSMYFEFKWSLIDSLEDVTKIICPCHDRLSWFDWCSNLTIHHLYLFFHSVHDKAQSSLTAMQSINFWSDGCPFIVDENFLFEFLIDRIDHLPSFVRVLRIEKSMNTFSFAFDLFYRLATSDQFKYEYLSRSLILFISRPWAFALLAL